MHSFRHSIVAIGLLFGFANCGGSDSKSSVRGQSCVPGKTRACVGPGACSSVQACGDDGNIWSACSCPAGAFDASPVDAAPADAAVAPAPKLVMIDDMEGSSTSGGPIKFKPPTAKLSPGSWWSGRSNGNTANTMSPDPFVYEALSAPHATLDGVTSTRGAHVICSIADLYGYCTIELWLVYDRAAPFDASGSSTDETDRRLPFDVSGYRGIVFWGRSSLSNSVKVKFNNTDTDTLGGNCGKTDGGADQCWDSFSTYLEFTDTWQKFEVKFSDLSQEGWGYRPASGKFDPTSVTGIGFQVNGPQSTTEPAVKTDFWIDDMYFE